MGFCMNPCDYFPTRVTVNPSLPISPAVRFFLYVKNTGTKLNVSSLILYLRRQCIGSTRVEVKPVRCGNENGIVDSGSGSFNGSSIGKRFDIKKIMILGAGPIVIDQACEFDYSGTQACKALKEDGYVVILINSNPATIMTNPDLAD
ncbi:hypothetical protein GIB67_024822 [Kingdonia uniflora]|uniref:Carbamoyl phosphate synthase preATP-grasp domain-containing protein n=1 Tax=Kingdonia uniflora TaxID=39325 RepID=A0A7J7NYN3_9MAGN|nr:hypothetical protein GIB67_024822 [Kingdonia uniflora]